jgi:hypothetical protein
MHVATTCSVVMNTIQDPVPEEPLPIALRFQRWVSCVNARKSRRDD